MKLFLFILIIFSNKAFSTDNYRVTIDDGTKYEIAANDLDSKLNWDDAKFACETYTENNKEDWFLPSKLVLIKMDELSKNIKKEKLRLNINEGNSDYWGSDEFSKVHAYLHFFNKDDEELALSQTKMDTLYSDKEEPANVRCVRKVK